MTLVRSVRLLGLVAVFLVACRSATAQQLQPVNEIEGITEYRLDNGIPVLLFPDSTRPQFTVNMTVLVGSRHEGYGETGMAHLLEHMLFKGTAQHPDIPKLLKDRGVLNMNGTTWIDRTNYYETLPASDDNLEFAIRMEADRLLNSLIRAEDLASEMTVVRNEFEIGENSPFRVLFQRVMASAYEWHNYGKSTIGNRSDIERVPIQNLRDFYTKFYQPDNVSVVVAGQFDRDKALEYLQKHFGSLQLPERKLPKTWTEEPQQDGERIVRLERVGDIQMTGAAFHIPSASHADYAAIEVLGKVLGLEPAGRLYQALVQSGLASKANCESIAGHDPGMLLCFAEVPLDKSLDTVQSTLLATLDEVAAKGVTEDEVRRAIQRLQSDREQEFANTENVAINLSEWQAYGDWRLYFLHRDRVENVTADDVRRVAAAYLIASNRTIGQFLPTSSPVRATIPASPKLNELLAGYKGRAKIVAGESFEPTPANIDARTTTGQQAGGMQFALLPKKTRGARVFISGQLKYGTLDSLRGKRLAATLLPELMQRGTASRTYQQIEDHCDEIRTEIGLSGEPGSLSFSVETRKEHMSAALAMLREMLREPSFPDDQFETMRTEQVAQLESSRSEPQMLAMNAMMQANNPWEKDDPRYNPTLDESIAELKAAVTAPVRQLHAEMLGASHGQVAVVGDFDPATISGELENVFAGWKSPQSYARVATPFTEPASVEPIRINTPDKASALYVAAQVLPIRDDADDYEALLIGNYILGGGPLSSRLADRVRKKEGLSYAVGSMVQAGSQDERGGLMMFAMSNPENTAKVVTTIKEELTRLVESGVTTEELENARSSFLETRTGDRSSDQAIAGKLRENLELGRTMQFDAASDAKIEGLTLEAVNSAIQKRIDPAKVLIITAGDFSKAAETETAEPARDGPAADKDGG